MKNYIILDMDGTLYQFSGGSGGTFYTSAFYQRLRKNMISFIAQERSLSLLNATKELERIHLLYDGSISVGVSKEYGIDTYAYFERTWTMDPNDFIVPDDHLSSLLHPFKGRTALLTAAPRIWADKVIDYLRLNGIFGERIYTGEPLIRKPNPLVFQNIVKQFGVEPNNVISIGDQEESDILPAKHSGLRTVRIGNSQDTQADYQAPTLYDAITLLRKEGLH